jgi:hypothetical protein
MNLHEHFPEGLSDEQSQILIALLTNPTKTNAAEALGKGRTWLYYRLRDDDELREAYNAMRAESIADATDSLMNVAESAVLVLHTIAHDPDVTPAVRVSSASKLLDTAIKAHEMADIVERIKTLERELAA